MNHRLATVMLLLAITVSILAADAHAAVIYVKWDSTYDGPGNDWDHAYHSVQAGLDAASSGDEVRVAGPHDYVECITLKLGVALFGGYAGVGDTRDIGTYETILDGNRQDSVVKSPPQATSTTVIDGFTIRNGIGTLSNGSRYGGGIYCTNSSPTITNNTISGNSAYSGGGIYCTSSSPIITNNTISGNTASVGGGICCANSSSMTIANNIINENNATGAGSGGIYCSNSSPTITNNNISGNSGGIYCDYSSPEISNNTISGNSSGIYCANSSSPMVSGNTISGNSGYYGGGISCYYSSPTITNNTISGNSASHGGGIYCSFASPTIMNNAVNGNSASYGGGGIYSINSSPAISNNTIGGNSSPSGGGIYCANSSSPTISNNILAFNSSGIYGSGGMPVLRNNCVYNPDGYNYYGISPGTGDISLDPRLEATSYSRVHIQPDSPCIDAGYDSPVQPEWVDMDGQPRIQGAHVDIGADESDGTLWSFTPTVVRVRPDGNDSDDGSSWTLAKRTVQAGIDAVPASGGEVWVVTGVYNERITLRRLVHVYGGFAGTEETREERDWTRNSTVLDGGTNGSVVRCVYQPGFKLSTIDGFTIRNGSASFGGGVYCEYSSPVITNNTITANSAGQKGGGIYCWDPMPPIANNTINGNSASYGGGIYCPSPTIISNNAITDNHASFRGGGIYSSSSSTVIIADNTISGNRASQGGGIYCSSPAVITDNNISGNGGGGIDCFSPAVIANNNISGNTGVGVYCKSSSPTVTNNTVTANSGEGIYCHLSSATIMNCIVAFNSYGIGRYLGAPALRNNDVYGNTAYDYSPGLSPGVGDISADPLFADTAAGNYHLLAGSPCINAGWNGAPGIPLTDMDGEPRIQGRIVDIGADEHQVRAALLNDARQAADDALLDAQGTIVSAAFVDFFYIEADDRSCGIRVEKPGHGLEAGMRADIVGSVATNIDGERYIEADTALENGTGDAVPLGMASRLLGGGDWLYNPSTGGGQRGITDAFGLNNIGLLITTWGRVTQIGADYLYVDDGSNLRDGTTTDSEENIGVRVICNPTGYTSGDIVEVTGISSCFQTPSGDLARRILTRNSEDIRRLSP